MPGAKSSADRSEVFIIESVVYGSFRAFLLGTALAIAAAAIIAPIPALAQGGAPSAAGPAPAGS